MKIYFKKEMTDIFSLCLLNFLLMLLQADLDIEILILKLYLWTTQEKHDKLSNFLFDFFLNPGILSGFPCCS